MGHRYPLLLTLGLCTTKGKCRKTLHQCRRAPLPSNTPSCPTSKCPGAHQLQAVTQSAGAFCETTSVWLFYFNLKLKNWEKAAIKGMKTYWEGTLPLVIHVSFSHMHKQKHIRPLGTSVFPSVKWKGWVTCRQIKPLHSGDYVTLKHHELWHNMYFGGFLFEGCKWNWQYFYI